MGQWQRHWQISAVGVLLCLLAAVFAFEAKVGWYIPNGHVRVELSSTKLQAADASRQMDQAHSAPASIPQFPEELPLFLGFAAVVLVTFVPRRTSLVRASGLPSFSPPHFFRPPPR
jgi:hypothetical protein